MAYTRRHGVVRSLIKVTDIAHIPYQKILFHEDEGYKLTFEVEEDYVYSDRDDEMLNANDDDKDKEKNGKKDDKYNDNKLGTDGGGKATNDQTSKRGGGVIINAPNIRNAASLPSMKFGSFSDKEGSMVEKEGTVLATSTCRRLFSSPVLQQISEETVVHVPAPASAATVPPTEKTENTLTASMPSSAEIVPLHEGPNRALANAAVPEGVQLMPVMTVASDVTEDMRSLSAAIGVGAGTSLRADPSAAITGAGRQTQLAEAIMEIAKFPCSEGDRRSPVSAQRHASGAPVPSSPRKSSPTSPNGSAPLAGAHAMGGAG
ncbi:hypothetical protein ACQ4PT_064122 [Festuca glaucescens]